MKIALISTVALTTPPRKYGGTELVVAELAKGLGTLGHDVTVFATGDSVLDCRVKHTFEAPVWPPNELSETRHAAFAWQEIARSLHQFDVVHLHHAAALPFTQLVPTPTALTIHHCRVEALVEHYRAYQKDVAFVAISERQADLLPELDVRSVIHHGLDPSLYPAGSGDGGYVAFLGRFAPEKAPHLAVEAACAAGVPIRLGGTYHEVAVDYYHQVLKPRLDAAPDAQCCGELGHEAKVELLRGASALLFPIQWEEPFGLVMIESMLMGTPVIAFRNGSAPEVVEDGLTGFLVDSAEEMAQCIGQLHRIDRQRCRERAMSRWSTARMAKEYADLYAQIARKRESSGRIYTAARGASPAQRPVSGITPTVSAGSSRFASQSLQSSPRLTKEPEHGATIRAGRG